MASLSTIDWNTVSRVTWDAIIVGAGPAGSVTATLLARAGKRVLLVERKNFPRDKVCGGCLNARALKTLKKLDLFDPLLKLKGIPLKTYRLSAYQNGLTLPLKDTLSISRRAWDYSLVQSAIEAGADFLENCSATLSKADSKTRKLVLQSHLAQQEISANIVILADGLGSPSIATNPEFPSTISKNSRIGAGTLFSENIPDFYTPGILYMAVNGYGYVGLVRVENGKLNVAAALEKNFIRKEGTIEAAINKILSEANFPILAKPETPWVGTQPLTRHLSKMAGERVFIIGDAASYIEPFTGEGMAWALASAVKVAPLALKGIANWDSSLKAQWNLQHRLLTGGRQFICKTVSFGMRKKTLLKTGMSLLSKYPNLATPLY